jgi:multicomponent Na+:H+ antiporter subunit G
VEPQAILAGILLGSGCFFLLTGGLGALRFPDFLSRMHPAAKGDTLGQALVLLGLMVELGFVLATLKLLLILLFLLVTSPTATHAMARAAHLSDQTPWPDEEPGS